MIEMPGDWKRTGAVGFILGLAICPSAGAAREVEYKPTSIELGIALTLDRFRDGCAEPGEGGCPPINIDRVLTRREHCRPARQRATASHHAIKPIYTVRCHFQSIVLSGYRNQPPSHWRSDQATLSLFPGPEACQADRSPLNPTDQAMTGFCQPDWQVEK
ncbi:hypothetical protein [Sphingomonas alpina]|uniref:Uncharacterized protein n=1 Tax=Sphingomonas alpina TaxID=653931 RepID=A0A7H0LIW6_9SPHN|nr:hypothetical protein [Sphingomonas alpina]QNQ09619.1 hypothetical protein H3Z74_23845 [Sphingomonas alpina]